jgi:ABC-type transporter Mla subunit MlaD
MPRNGNNNNRKRVQKGRANRSTTTKNVQTMLKELDERLTRLERLLQQSGKTNAPARNQAIRDELESATTVALEVDAVDPAKTKQVETTVFDMLRQYGPALAKAAPYVMDVVEELAPMILSLL